MPASPVPATPSLRQRSRSAPGGVVKRIALLVSLAALGVVCYQAVSLLQ